MEELDVDSIDSLEWHAEMFEREAAWLSKQADATYAQTTGGGTWRYILGLDEADQQRRDAKKYRRTAAQCRERIAYLLQQQSA